MNTLLAAAFLALLAAEAAGTATFLVIYVRSSDWRASPVGRHLVIYSATLLGLLVLALLSFAVPSPVLVWLILLGHFVFAGVIWQRVVLVWRAQHRPDRPNPRLEVTGMTQPTPPSPNTSSTEPLLSVGAITAVASALLALLVLFGVHLTGPTQAAILSAIGVLAPLIVAVWGRRKVYAPATVARLLAARRPPPM